MIHVCKGCDGTGEVIVTRFGSSPNAYEDEVACGACGGHGAWCKECYAKMDPNDTHCPYCGEPAMAEAE